MSALVRDDAMTWFRLFLLLSALAAMMLPACSRHADQARRFTDRGILLVEAEQFNEAIRLFNKAIDVSPQYADAYLQLALLYDDRLNDTTNAVAAYERFIAIATDAAAKERAERWLASARERQDFSDDDVLASQPASILTSSSLQDELKRKERQFDLLRQQTVERYEGVIDTLKNQIETNRIRMAALERENAVFRGSTAAVEHAAVLDAIASNEQIVTELRTALDVRTREMEEMTLAQVSLQSLVTNLQSRIAVAEALTNSPVVVAGEDVTHQLLALERERNDLQSRCLRMQELLARATSGTTAVSVVHVSTGTMVHVASVTPALAPAVRGTRTTAGRSTTTPAVTGRTVAGRSSSSSVTGRVAAVRPVRPVASTEVYPSERTYPALPDTSVSPVTPIAETSGPPRTYIVQPGDSLMKIARNVYGDQNKWTLLYDGNRDTLDRPNNLKIGQAIRVPTLKP